MKRFISIFLILTMILTQLQVPAEAHHFEIPGGETAEPPGDPDPGQTPARGDAEDCPGGATDPVCLDRGEFVHRAQDLFLPGRGLSLELKRIYRSNSIYHSPFGYGWDINYNLKVRKLADGSFILLTGTNRKEPIAPDGSGPPGFYDALETLPDGTYLLTRKHGEKVFFDIDGNVSRIEDRFGNYLTFTYDPVGRLPLIGPSKYFVDQVEGVIALEYRLIRVEDALGRFFEFFYDGKGRLDHVTDSAGRTAAYTYDASNNLESVTSPATPDYPTGLTTTYSYDLNHRLETITDAKAQTYVTNVYNSDGKVESQTLLGLGTTTLVYDGEALTTDVTDRNGFRTLWSFSAEGRPTRREQFTQGLRIGDPASFVTTYEYDANGELRRSVLPRGNIVENTYDALGNLLETRRKPIPGSPDLDIVTTFTYEPNFNLIKTVTDPRGNTTAYTYDYEVGAGDQGKLMKIAFPSVGGEIIETHFTYNAFGQILTVTDPSGSIAKYTYDPASGYLQTITQGFGTTEAAMTTLGYDALGNVTSIQDPNGNITAFQYNTLIQLKKVISPTPFGYETLYAYDENGNLKEIKREANEAGTEFQVTSYAYTALNQLETITDNDGNITTFEYDGNRNRTKIIDAELKETSYLYDERNLLFQVTDARLGVTEYAYDGNGNLKSVKDAGGNTTSYTYDDFDRLEETQYADTSTDSYTYDQASNLTSKTNAEGQVISYTYDELNRLTLKEYTGCPSSLCGGDVAYDYDQGSRLGTVSNSLISTQYQYDALNRVKVETYTLGGNTYAVSSGYGPTGNRTELTNPSGTLIKYAYDTLNRLDEINDSLDQVLYDFTYDPLSRRTSLSRPNTLTTSYAYDMLSRLTAITNSAGSPIGNITYPLYDKVGNRKEEVNNIVPTSPLNYTYTYDQAYELTDVSDEVPASQFNYTYDPVGNRTASTEQGTAVTYVPNILNQYDQVDATSYTYDLKGNLTNDGNYDYHYDFENRLVEVSEGATTISSFAYDPLGRRFTRTAGLETSLFIRDGDQILETYSCDTDLLNCTLDQSFIYSDRIDEALELTLHPSLDKHFYHTDALGNTVALADVDGNITELYQYDPYGKPHFFDSAGNSIAESTVSNPYLFTGREYEPQTKLYYFRARYYSPQTGRFLQRDPFTWGPDDPRRMMINELFYSVYWLTSEMPGTQVFDNLSDPDAGFLIALLEFTGSFWPQLRVPYLYVSNRPLAFVDPYGLIKCNPPRDWNYKNSQDAMDAYYRNQLEKRLAEKYAKHHKVPLPVAQKQASDWLHNRGNQKQTGWNPFQPLNPPNNNNKNG